MDTVVVTLPCEAEQLRLLRQRLRDWLAHTELSLPVQEAIVLAAHEAAAHAIEHATPCNTLDMRASIEHDALTIEVTGTGQWRDPSESDRERVQRLALIQRLIEHIEIDPGPQSTTMRLRQPL